MGWTVEESEFDFRQGQGIFLFSTASKSVLESNHIQSRMGAFSLG
jgi:hypothetical protein